MATIDAVIVVLDDYTVRGCPPGVTPLVFAIGTTGNVADGNDLSDGRHTWAADTDAAWNQAGGIPVWSTSSATPDPRTICEASGSRHQSQRDQR